VLVRPDAPVFPPAEEGLRGLRRRPFLDEAEILHEVRWLDAGRDAVHRVCPDREDAIPEGRRVHLALKAADAGKSAARAPRLADAVLDLDCLASDVPQANHGKRLMPPVFAAEELYTPAEDQSAA
jgi:hypothetical protein